MGVQLLDKTRKINKLLHNNSSSKVVFNDICEVLTEILNSNVLVILSLIHIYDRKADRNHFTGTVMGRKSGNYEDLQCIGAGGSGIPADHTASVS